jgi:hypothetical protein
MSPTLSRPAPWLAASTLALACAMSPAQAATQQRSFVQNATGACQSALPVFDGNIRKRPLAVQNEGTAAAFVSCSLMDTSGGVGGASSVTSVFMYADNNTGAAVDLTCTLVDGYSGGTNVFLPKTLTLPANSKAHPFLWTAAADNGGANFNWTTNLTCQLPVGTGLSLSFVYYDEDVGA